MYYGKEIADSLQVEIQEIKDWFEIYKKRKNKNRQEWVLQNPIPGKEKIESLYEKGYGYKTFAKVFGESPIVVRDMMIKYLNINYRKGIFVTDTLKKDRKRRALIDNNFRDWPNKRPHMLDGKVKSTGIQGFYKNKDGKYIWLRSSWEYIYAKWLDKQNHLKWEVEPDVFVLSNGENYRPDFKVIDTISNRTYYVEVKGTFYTENRDHKPVLLKEMGYDIVTITDVLPYTNLTYNEELKLWKQEKLSKDELLERT